MAHTQHVVKSLEEQEKIVTMLSAGLHHHDGASGICEISQWNYKVKSTVCSYNGPSHLPFCEAQTVINWSRVARQMTGVREICEKNICNDAGCVYNMHEAAYIHSVSHTKNTILLNYVSEEFSLVFC